MSKSSFVRTDEFATYQMTFPQFIELLPTAQAILDDKGFIRFASLQLIVQLTAPADAEDSILGTSISKWIQPLSDEISLQEVLAKVAFTGAKESLPASLIHTRKIVELHVHRFSHDMRTGPTSGTGLDIRCPSLWLLMYDMPHSRLTEQEIKRAERLASIGELSANLAHELNNPLDGALRYLHFLLDDLGPEDPRRKYAMYVQDGLQRMARIVKGLLHFSRQGPQSLEPIDIHETLDQVILFFGDDLEKKQIEVRKIFASDIPTLLGRDLEHVFLNLVKNAIQAMPEGGILTLRSYMDTQNAAPGQIVCIEISDTGHGIPWEIQQEIFTPFFTTKDVGEGTGLGLSISRGIVERYHGEIQIESQLHQGTRVTIRIPIDTAE